MAVGRSTPPAPGSDPRPAAGRVPDARPGSRGPRAHRAFRRARTLLRRSAVDYFRGEGSDWTAFAVLLLSVPLIALATLGWTEWCPPEALVLPLLIGGMVLRPSSLLMLYAGTAVALVAETALLEGASPANEPVTPGTVLVIGAVALAALLVAQFRSRVGVPWRRGSTMLFDLRERIRAQSDLPALPGDWQTEMALRPAGGQSFSGDFVVASRTGPNGQTLEIVVTDVSGKGMDAASRSLLLSGAFGGLLGSLPPHEFLPAANGYLLRQDWDEGFATSIHLVLDLDTGDYEVFSAGHPPGVQLAADTGQWHRTSAEGPLLGIWEGAEFHPAKGRLGSGDVLMLFTDGLVERADRDLDDGIDRLTGVAERLLSSGRFFGTAWELIEAVARDVNDDRALLLIRRS